MRLPRTPLALALVAALTLGWAPWAGGQPGALSGSVVGGDGLPLPGAVVLLHRAGAATLTDARGGFALPAPAGDDVLVAAKEGFRDALVHVNRSAPGPLQVVLRAPEAVVERTESFTETTRFTAAVPFGNTTLGPGQVAEMAFPVDRGAVEGTARVRWGPAVGGFSLHELRVDMRHEESGQRYGIFRGSDGNLSFSLPPALLAPGTLVLETRVNAGVVLDLLVEGSIAVRYGSAPVKAVQGKPPEVTDPSGDFGALPHPGMDLRSVAFSNEGEHQFDVVLGLSRLETLAPERGGVAVWMVRWEHGGVSYYVAFTAERVPRPRLTPPEAFTLGYCTASTGLCTRTHVIPGQVVLGAPGAIVFHVPKAASGRPGEGSALTQPRAVAFQSGSDVQFAEAVIVASPTDGTEPGRDYVFGLLEFAVPEGILRALRGGQAPGPGWWPLLALVLAAGGASALVAGRRVARTVPRRGDARYERLRLLGEGAGGRTYLARHRQLGKLVAIKELHGHVAGSRDARESLLREARICATIRHPNVVEVYDVDEHGGQVAIVMEYVDGGSLQDALADAPLPAPRALRVWRDVAAALVPVHAAGVLHRDVKPSNILLTGDGTAKLADFGVARSSAERTLVAAASGGLSPSSQVGTPLYMAPEQFEGQPPSPASDVYAAAAVAYLALTGKSHVDLPEGGSWPQLLAARHRPPRLPVGGAPGWANALLARCLSPRPGERPGAGQVAEALEAGIRGGGG